MDSAAISPGSLVVVMDNLAWMAPDFVAPSTDSCDALAYAFYVSRSPSTLWHPAPSMMYVGLDCHEPKPRAIGKADQRRATVRAGLRLRCLLKRVPVSLRRWFVRKSLAMLPVERST